MDPLNLAVNRHLVAENQRRLYSDDLPPEPPPPTALRLTLRRLRTTFRRSTPRSGHVDALPAKRCPEECT
ncbi:hypothetical protein [Kribbella deserti]|uniref:Uncharacterized protein n=1 Tax=Kribbella deserti TaxID=1926257 RepID=A0ABV6QXR1_9ACTN